MRRTGLQRAAVVIVAVGLLVGVGSTFDVTANGTPADKAAMAGSGLEEVGSAEPILEDTMKVDSVADLILTASVECSIINRLVTDNDNLTAQSVGRVKLWVTIDDIVVPVAGDDTNEPGKVVFCDRTYGRTVEDQEGDGKVDEEDDFIATRTSNAFTWFATDAGTGFDSLTNGNNVVDVKLWAEFTRTTTQKTCPAGTTCAAAFVGKRTLLAEATHVAVNEAVNRNGTEGP